MHWSVIFTANLSSASTWLHKRGFHWLEVVKESFLKKVTFGMGLKRTVSPWSMGKYVSRGKQPNCAPSVLWRLPLRANIQKGKPTRAALLPKSSFLLSPSQQETVWTPDPVSVPTQTLISAKMLSWKPLLHLSQSALQPRGFLLWEAFSKYLKKVANSSARSIHVELTGKVGAGRQRTTVQEPLKNPFSCGDNWKMIAF